MPRGLMYSVIGLLGVLAMLVALRNQIAPESLMLGLVIGVVAMLFGGGAAAWQWRLAKLLRIDGEAPADSVARSALNLEHEVKALAARAESLIQAQRELTRAVAHELRTPVARIRFGVDMVIAAKSEEERNKRLQAMERDIAELEQLIDEILVYARLDSSAPPLVMQSVCLPTLLEGVVADARRGVSQKAVAFANHVAEDQWLRAEPLYLQRALQNVVGNAVKYSRAHVDVRYDVVDSQARITVDDDGPGIPIDAREKIFETFARLDASRSRKSGGHGLGLAIVKRVMEWHQGGVSIHVSPYGGARFVLSLPLGDPREGA
jgi:two-component system, OmpR family, sensor histidine kinase RstB